MIREITIDAAGRIVIPKDVRRRHHLSRGTRLLLEEEEGQLVLTPVRDPPLFTNEDGLLVFRGRLTGEVLDHRELREDRMDHLAGER